MGLFTTHPKKAYDESNIIFFFYYLKCTFPVFLQEIVFINEIE
jgi:hypothetical protein